MFVFKAAVVGAGAMGGQIAQTIASAGIPVVLKGVEDDLVEAGLNEARKVTQNQVGKLVERGKLNEEAAGVQVAAVVDRIHGTTQYDGFGDVDFVIEAVPERMEIKQAVFSDLDAVTPGHAILASNTSSLSITEIGEATSRPDRVCGFHYFHPAAATPTTAPRRRPGARPRSARATPRRRRRSRARSRGRRRSARCRSRAPR